jgi:hypothetical protein
MHQSDPERIQLIRSELLRVDGADPGAQPSQKHRRMTDDVCQGTCRLNRFGQL